jgi:hypothetical protein
VRDLGWLGVKNGALLSRMGGRFDVLLTADQNIFAQQNLTGLDLAIVIVPTTRRAALMMLVPILIGVLQTIRRGEHVTLSPDGSIAVQTF